MTKPFDVKDLEEKFKAKGMQELVCLGVDVIEVVVAWIEESVQLTEGKYDDIAIPILEALKPYIEKKIKELGS